MQVPFCLPLLDAEVIAEVNDTLTNTGWLTTGPKVRALEAEIQKLSGAPAVLCVNSWTSGAMLLLKWFGVGPGDEVIISAYTYSATALCAINLGAKVVMVDIGADDFHLDPAKLKAAITPRTKAIIPVDIGGWPADYDAIFAVLADPEVRALFQAGTGEQEQLGRPMVMTDAAHSIGALYKGRVAGTLCDATVFSLHSVKNVTTAEGGAVCLQFPEPFDNVALGQFLKVFSLNGQTKTALEKNQPGAWRYDIIAPGLKVNMPDICAAVGLAQIRRYADDLLPERQSQYQRYLDGFAGHPLLELQPYRLPGGTVSSCHLVLLRVRGLDEAGRDELIRQLALAGIGTSVHYIPMAMLTLFKNLGYRMADYPNTYARYANVLSLPIYNGLRTEQIDYVIEQVRRWVDGKTDEADSMDWNG